jgi:hypothetical protein
MFNMTAPLIECTKRQQRHVIRALWLHDHEIYGRITFPYGDNCVSWRNFYKWMEKFKWGLTCVYDMHSGLRWNIIYDEVKKHIYIYQRIRDNWTINTDKTEFEMSTRHVKRRCKNDLWPIWKVIFLYNSGNVWKVEPNINFKKGN